MFDKEDAIQYVKDLVNAATNAQSQFDARGYITRLQQNELTDRFAMLVSFLTGEEMKFDEAKKVLDNML
jgi:polyhydroxyalkanoate synthesis regulator phasin